MAEVIVLPVLNEVEGLRKLLPKVDHYSVVVLDGGSTDGSLELAKKYGCAVIIQKGKGKGRAFQDFLVWSRGRFADKFVMLDADASYDITIANKFFSALNDFEVVAGERTTLPVSLTGWFHYVGNKLISLIALVLFWKWNPDICTGYWGFRGNELSKLSISAERFDLEANIFSEVCKKLRFKRIPISYFDRVGDRKLSSVDALSIVGKLFVERFIANRKCLQRA